MENENAGRVAKASELGKKNRAEEEDSSSRRISKAGGQEYSIFNLDMGNGCNLAAGTHIKVIVFLQDNPRREGEILCVVKKTTKNPFSYTRSENVVYWKLCIFATNHPSSKALAFS